MGYRRLLNQRSLLVLTLVVCLAASIAPPSVAAPQREPSRAQAGRLLAPMLAFDRAVRTRGLEVRRALAEWQQHTTPCLASLRLDLAAAADAERMASTRLRILEAQVSLDGLAHAYASVDGRLASAQRAWRTLAVRHRSLRALAREQARRLGRLRGFDAGDTCAFYARWKATGLDPARVPQTVQAALDELARPHLGTWRRGTRTLRRLVSRRLADRFELFPLAAGLVTADEVVLPLDRAMPGILEERIRPLDGAAKIAARNLVSVVESCFATRQDYRRCNARAELDLAGGDIDYGAGPCQASVVAATRTSYTAEAVSMHSVGVAFQRFRIVHRSGDFTRTCAPRGHGGCPARGPW